MKDLLEELESLGYINKDNYEYVCNSCSYTGDSCDYETIEKDYDDEGYPIGDTRYIEKCPNCGSLLNI